MANLNNINDSTIQSSLLSEDMLVKSTIRNSILDEVVTDIENSESIEDIVLVLDTSTDPNITVNETKDKENTSSGEDILSFEKSTDARLTQKIVDVPKDENATSTENNIEVQNKENAASVEDIQSFEKSTDARLTQKIVDVSKDENATLTENNIEVQNKENAASVEDIQSFEKSTDATLTQKIVDVPKDENATLTENNIEVQNKENAASVEDIQSFEHAEEDDTLTKKVVDVAINKNDKLTKTTPFKYIETDKNTSTVTESSCKANLRRKLTGAARRRLKTLIANGMKYDEARELCFESVPKTFTQTKKVKTSFHQIKKAEERPHQIKITENKPHQIKKDERRPYQFKKAEEKSQLKKSVSERKFKKKLSGAAKKRLRMLISKGMAYSEARVLCRQTVHELKHLEETTPNELNDDVRNKVDNNTPSFLYSKENSSHSSVQEYVNKYTDVERLPNIIATKEEMQKWVKVAVRDSTAMSVNKLKLLKRFILEEVDRTPRGMYQPRFIACHRKSGWLLVVCADKGSYNWLDTVIGKLKPWPDAQLQLRDFIPLKRIGLFRIPNTKADPEMILKRLEVQNKNLITKRWRVLDCKQYKKSQSITFSFDEESYKTLQNINFSPYLNFGKIKIRIKESRSIKEMQEETSGAIINKDRSDMKYNQFQGIGNNSTRADNIRKLHQPDFSFERRNTRERYDNNNYTSNISNFQTRNYSEKDYEQFSKYSNPLDNSDFPVFETNITNKFSERELQKSNYQSRNNFLRPQSEFSRQNTNTERFYNNCNDPIFKKKEYSERDCNNGRYRQSEPTQSEIQREFQSDCSFQIKNEGRNIGNAFYYNQEYSQNDFNTQRDLTQNNLQWSFQPNRQGSGFINDDHSRRGYRESEKNICSGSNRSNFDRPSQSDSFFRNFLQNRSSGECQLSPPIDTSSLFNFNNSNQSSRNVSNDFRSSNQIIDRRSSMWERRFPSTSK